MALYLNLQFLIRFPPSPLPKLEDNPVLVYFDEKDWKTDQIPVRQIKKQHMVYDFDNM